MKLPNKIKVACFDIEIREWDAKTANVRGCFGEYSGDECIIRIDATHNSQRVVETLIHEITHAIYHLYCISDEDKEERIVTAISRGWFQVYRDNPEVLDLVHFHVARTVQ